MIPTTPTLLHVIRARTRVLHQEVEALPAMQGILEQTDMLAYHAFLSVFLLVVRGLANFRPVEAPFARAYPDWLHRLSQDLAAMGLPLATGGGPRADCRIDTMEQFWGFAYVIEGSAMGGRQLMHGWTPHRHWPHSFVSRSLDPEALPRWHEFLKSLNEASPLLAAPAVIESAAQAFQLFHRRLAEVPSQSSKLVFTTHHQVEVQDGLRGH